MVRIALAATGFRVLSAILALFANLTFPAYQPTSVTMFGRPSPFWDAFIRYDSGWYYQIARNGYAFVAGGPSVGVGKAGKIAFFPVYPILMRHAGQVVTRKMLCEHLWDADWEGETNVIEVHITRLRGKLDRAAAGSPIQTVRGRGYVLRTS